jgi:hypothetical protein
MNIINKNYRKLSQKLTKIVFKDDNGWFLKTTTVTTLRGNQLPAALKRGCIADKYLNTRESDIEHRRYTIKLGICNKNYRKLGQKLTKISSLTNEIVGCFVIIKTKIIEEILYC